MYQGTLYFIQYPKVTLYFNRFEEFFSEEQQQVSLSQQFW